MSTVVDPGKPITSATSPGHHGRLRGRLRAYLALTKPRIVELLLVTTVPAMLLAAAGDPPIGRLVVVVVAGACAAGAANALNCYLDRDLDAVMRRTAHRPLPAHTIAPRAALVFGLALATVATALMAAFTTVLATLLTVAAIAYYDLVYTWWLKRSTPLSTFWGGVCGAAPILIGWSAVTGSLAPLAWAMFGIVFFWQMPHFYALALSCREDYARAGIPMLPVVASARRVALESLAFAWLTVLCSLLLWPLGLGWGYGLAAAAAGALFLVEAHRLSARVRTGSPLRPKRLFHASTTYLTVVFVAIALAAVIGAA